MTDTRRVAEAATSEQYLQALDRIAALEAENVELREALEKQKWNTELLRRAAGYVQDASTRYYDGTDGASIRLGAKALALAIDLALKETP